MDGNGCTRRIPRFGRKVTLSDHRFDHDGAFGPQRLRLADIGGSGHADVVYLSGPGATVYVNRSGNDPADPVTIPLPVATVPHTVQVLDLLGTGTACLIWSSSLPDECGRPVAYGELMAAGSHGGSSGCSGGLSLWQASRTVMRLTQCSGNGRQEVHSVPTPTDLAGCCDRRP